MAENEKAKGLPAINGRAIVEGNMGADQRTGFLAALAGVEGGVTVQEFQLRFLATGAPLWQYLQRKSDLHWFATHGPGKAKGTVYEYVHSEESKGKMISPAFAFGDKPEHKVKSIGDGQTRYLYVGNISSPVLGLGDSGIRKMATSIVAQWVKRLREAGATADQMRATQVFKDIEALGIEVNYGSAPKSETPAKTKTSTKSRKKAAVSK